MTGIGRILILAMLGALALLICGPIAHAQQPEIDAIAAHLAIRFKSGHSGFVKRIAVPDCIGPDMIETRLDIAIADELSAALQNADSKLQIYPREKLNALLSQNNLNASTLDSDGGKKAFLKLTDNTDFIVCHLRVADKKMHVDVATYSHWVNLHGQKKIIAQDEGEFDLTPEVEAAGAIRIETSNAAPLAAPVSPVLEVPEIISLAAELAKELESQNLRSVEMVDCCDLGDKPDIRKNIGDALRNKLSAADPDLRILPLFVLHLSWLTLSERESLDSERFRRGLLKQTKADALVVAETGLDNGKATLRVALYSKDGTEFTRRIAEFSDLKAFAKPNLEASSDSQLQAYEAGKNGVGNPSCTSCPPPQPTVASLRHKTGGVVQLKVWIDENGDVVREQVLQGLPDGLTDSALDGVRSWKFRPAVDSDGKPVAVYVEVLITFSFSKRN